MTRYCSPKCQSAHWQAVHKTECRQLRQKTEEPRAAGPAAGGTGHAAGGGKLDDKVAPAQDDEQGAGTLVARTDAGVAYDVHMAERAASAAIVAALVAEIAAAEAAMVVVKRRGRWC